MDRNIVYPGAIPLDTDLLSPQREAMIGLGWLLQATMGTATGVVGLACTPTTPATMVVNVGPGAIWEQSEIDATAFGSLALDTSPLMKIGINAEAAGTNFTLTAPGTSGQSINYLIEATFLEADGTPVVLPYVNPANPALPYSGPSNSGTAQNTKRAETVELQLKAGAAATTGTQTTPAVDAGYVGLYVITVAYGQSTVTSTNISTYSGAPFVTALPNVLTGLSGLYAALNGSASQTFAVAPAVASNQAVQLGQVGGPNRTAAFTSSGNWTAPSGVTEVLASGCGGGGGGGGGDSSSGVGGGGGGGGSAFKSRVAVTPGTQYAITIGAGGAGGISTGAGAAGGATSFGSLLTLPGGGGGAVGPSGLGGAAGNSLAQPGNNGVASTYYNTTSVGGSCPFGFGGVAQGAGQPGGVASGYGGGGGGGGNAAGGNGTPGFLILEY